MDGLIISENVRKWPRLPLMITSVRVHTHPGHDNYYVLESNITALLVVLEDVSPLIPPAFSELKKPFEWEAKSARTKRSPVAFDNSIPDPDLMADKLLLLFLRLSAFRNPHPFHFTLTLNTKAGNQDLWETKTKEADWNSWISESFSINFLMSSWSVNGLVTTAQSEIASWSLKW